MEMGIAGRSALITGGSGGIGSEIALLLAEEDAKVGLLVRDPERARGVLERIRGVRPQAVCSVAPAELASMAEVTAAVDRIASALGGLDIVVNCAGDSPRGGLDELDEADWVRSFSIKPLGCLRVCKAALPFLKNSPEGRIVNIAGGHGKEPTAYSMMGGMANAGTLSFTKSLSLQLAPYGITVNAVNPGHTATGRWTALIERTARETGLGRAEAETLLLQRVPLRRVIPPRDVAAAVAFLCSGHAGTITGCVLNVDGGRARSI